MVGYDALLWYGKPRTAGIEKVTRTAEASGLPGGYCLDFTLELTGVQRLAVESQHVGDAHVGGR